MGIDPHTLEVLLEEHRDWVDRHPCSVLSPCKAKPRPVVSGDWRALVAKHFPGQYDKAVCVVLKESGGDARARNPSSGAAGLFQHLPKYWAERSRKAGYGGRSIYDIEANVAVAAWLQRTGGWSHWSVVKKGLC